LACLLTLGGALGVWESQALARGMGVEGARATTADELVTHLTGALGRKGPFLIEAVL
jgi:thiamine pyrophosphate-dependent acetolactate synthase large subunit-like protein